MTASMVLYVYTNIFVCVCAYTQQNMYVCMYVCVRGKYVYSLVQEYLFGVFKCIVNRDSIFKLSFREYMCLCVYT